MTKDEIWRLAKEAGSIPIHKDYSQHVLVGNDVIERFAALVAEKEREECAKECDARVFARDGGGNLYKREATASQCALAIRARGQK
jgi:hypothetical protein